jgi:hypothetical protein
MESVVELAEEIAATKVSTTQKNLTKQVAKTALRPDGGTAKKLDLTKAPGDMTDEELDAFLTQNGVPVK